MPSASRVLRSQRPAKYEVLYHCHKRRLVLSKHNRSVAVAEQIQSCFNRLSEDWHVASKIDESGHRTIQKPHSMEKQADRCNTYQLPRRLMDAATWMCWSCSSVRTPLQSSARQHQSSQAVLGSLFLVLQHFWSTEQHSWSTAVRMLASSSCAEPSWPWASQASFSSLHSSLQPGSAPSLELP